MPDVLAILAALPDGTLLAVAGVVLIAESGALIGVLLPGASLLVALGVAAQLNLVPLAAALGTALLATVAGAHTRFRRTRPLSAVAKSRMAKDPVGDLGLRFTDRFAGRPRLLVMVGHCVGGVRTLIPKFAARQGIPYSTFALANVLAAAIWVGSFVLAGYLLADRADQVSTVGAALGLPMVAAAVAVRWIHRRTQRDQQTEPVPVRPPVPVMAS